MLLAASRRLAPSLFRGNTAAALQSVQLQGLRTFSTDDSHDDFKPQYKSGAPAGIETTIEDDINNNKVFLYMKGVPEAPMCGFSAMACRILNAYGVPYGSRNVLADPEIREGIKQYTAWPTIPQVFIGGEFVGGSDILLSMHQSGELTEALEKAGVASSSSSSGDK